MHGKTKELQDTQKIIKNIESSEKTAIILFIKLYDKDNKILCFYQIP
jgi:hypothetical protein